MLFSLIAVGGAANQLGGAGGPLAVFVVTIFAAEFGKLVSKETKVDIIVTPSVTICVGVLLSMWWAPSIGAAASAVAMPSSGNGAAALLHGDSGFRYRRHRADTPHQQCGNLCGSGADRLGRRCGSCRLLCADGCFAVMSFKENKWSGLLAQGIGTSMLQIGNIVKNPLIWIPPTLASAVTGPIATCIFRMKVNGDAVASGMGTCGLVGQIGVYTGWINDITAGTKAGITSMDWLGLVLVCFILPAVLTLVFAYPMRKKNLIKENDLKLDL